MFSPDFSQYLFSFLKIGEKRWRGRGLFFQLPAIAILTNMIQQFSLSAQCSQLSSHLGREKNIHLCSSCLPLTLIFFNDVWYLSSGPAPIIPCPMTGFVCLIETILCVSVWQPTAWLYSSSYPFLCSHLFPFVFFFPLESKNVKFQMKLYQDKVFTFSHDFFYFKSLQEKNVHSLEGTIQKLAKVTLLEQW